MTAGQPDALPHGTEMRFTTSTGVTPRSAQGSGSPVELAPIPRSAFSHRRRPRRRQLPPRRRFPSNASVGIAVMIAVEVAPTANYPYWTTPITPTAIILLSLNHDALDVTFVRPESVSPCRHVAAAAIAHVAHDTRRDTS